MTVGGTEVSLAAGGSDVVVGTSTEALAPLITAGFGSGANGIGVQSFTGGASERRGWRWGGGWGKLGVAGLIGLGVIGLEGWFMLCA